MQIDEFKKEDFTPEELAMFEADAAEAERGYDLAKLLQTKPHTLHPENWHPEEWGKVVQFRYNRDRIAILDQRARAAGKSRSQVLREAVDAYLDVA